MPTNIIKIIQQKSSEICADLDTNKYYSGAILYRMHSSLSSAPSMSERRTACTLTYKKYIYVQWRGENDSRKHENLIE